MYSTRAKNLEKVGLFTNILNPWAYLRERPWFFLNFLKILFRLIVFPFLSWISAGIRVYTIFSKETMSKEVREVSEILSNKDLNENEVKELLKKISGEEEDLDNNTLILVNDEDWYRDIELYENKIYCDSHPTDYQSSFNSIYEYKIEWIRVYQRLLEEKVEHIGSGKHYDVKDWIVLESDMRERFKKDVYSIVGSSLDNRIKELKKECKWNEIMFYKTKAFILSRNPKIVSKQEFKRYIRWELERIKLWILKTEEFCKKHNVEFIYNDDYKSYYFKFLDKKITNKRLNDFEEAKIWFLKKIECTEYELNYYDDMVNTLNEYLSDEK